MDRIPLAFDKFFKHIQDAKPLEDIVIIFFTGNYGNEELKPTKVKIIKEMIGERMVEIEHTPSDGTVTNCRLICERDYLEYVVACNVTEKQPRGRGE